MDRVAYNGRIILAAGIIVMLFLGISGMTHTLLSHEHMHGQPHDNCIIPGMTVVCTMDIFSHIEAMQRAYIAYPMEHYLSSLLALFGICIALLFLYSRRSQELIAHAARHTVRTRDHNARAVPALLVQLFSSGILHPKPY